MFNLAVRNYAPQEPFRRDKPCDNNDCRKIEYDHSCINIANTSRRRCTLPPTKYTSEKRMPVTILSGVLGIGQAALVNCILSEQQDQRVVVIVNEFGDIGIDGQLVIGVKEIIVKLSNGCICCTVHGKLALTLHTLKKNRIAAVRFARDLSDES